MNGWEWVWLLVAAGAAWAVPLLMVPSALAWRERRRREEEAAKRREAEQLRIALRVVVDAVQQIGDEFTVTMRAVGEAASDTARSMRVMFAPVGAVPGGEGWKPLGGIKPGSVQFSYDRQASDDLAPLMVGGLREWSLELDNRTEGDA